MPCQFKYKHVNFFEPTSDQPVAVFDQNSENAFGNSCQFTFFDEAELRHFEGKTWCPFHLPLTGHSGDSEKTAWHPWNQAALASKLAGYIEDRRKLGKPIDLCGLVHWDRLTFAFAYNVDASGAHKVDYKNLPALALDGAHFPRGVDFQGLHFAKPVYARNVFFGDQADFYNIRFSDHATFAGSIFKKGAEFCESRFEKSARFAAVEFGGQVNFIDTEFEDTADFAVHDYFDMSGPPPANSSILTGLFTNARFLGPARFNDREFLFGPIFEKACFSVAPEFHNSKFHQSANFNDAKFLDKSSPGSDHAYRTLKLAMEKLGARDEQAMFFALEQESRASKSSTPRTIALFSHLYRDLSNYGQDFARPLLWLIAVTIVFLFLYAAILTFLAGGRIFSTSYLLNFTLEQMVRPFLIWAPDYLQKAGITPDLQPTEIRAYELLLKVMSTINALLFFGLTALSLLALRRRFKLD